MTTVHDITEDVSKIVPRDLSTGSVLVKIVLEDNGGVSQVTDREGIHHVETLRSELSSFEHH